MLCLKFDDRFVQFQIGFDRIASFRSQRILSPFPFEGVLLRVDLLDLFRRLFDFVVDSLRLLHVARQLGQIAETLRKEKKRRRDVVETNECLVVVVVDVRKILRVACYTSGVRR